MATIAKKLKLSLTAIAFVLGIGAAFATNETNSAHSGTTYYDEVTGPKDCDITNCTPMGGQICTQIFYLDQNCEQPVSVTLRKNNP